MEPTLYAVIERLREVEPKNSESLSAELLKIENEFDNEITKSEKTGFNTGLFVFNFDLKQKHNEIIASLLPEKEEIVISKVSELKEEESEIIEEELPIIEPVEEIVIPIKIEPDLSTIKPKASKAKIVKDLEH